MNLSKARITAAGVHLAISCLVAAIVAIVVFVIWFPYPYRVLSGGTELFFIVVMVDVVMGPALTFIVFDMRKTMKKLYLDIIFIAALQVTALGYGIWSVSLARPVHLVFEINRFRAVHAYEVPRELLANTPSGIVAFPWWGPSVLSLRSFRNVNEEIDVTLGALQGTSLASRPDLWQSYEYSKLAVLAVSKPISDLQRRYPDKVELIQHALKNMDDPANAVYLPMIVRDHFWTIVLDAKTVSPVAHLPIDSF